MQLKDLIFGIQQKARHSQNILIAVNHQWNNKETVTWWKVLVFGKPAEWAERSRKVMLLQASGDHYMERWIDKEGNKRYTSLAAMTVINHSYKKKVEKQGPSYNDIQEMTCLSAGQPFHGWAVEKCFNAALTGGKPSQLKRLLSPREFVEPREIDQSVQQ